MKHQISDQSQLSCGTEKGDSSHFQQMMMFQTLHDLRLSQQGIETLFVVFSGLGIVFFGRRMKGLQGHGITFVVQSSRDGTEVSSSDLFQILLNSFFLSSRSVRGQRYFEVGFVEQRSLKIDGKGLFSSLQRRLFVSTKVTQFSCSESIDVVDHQSPVFLPFGIGTDVQLLTSSRRWRRRRENDDRRKTEGI